MTTYLLQYIRYSCPVYIHLSQGFLPSIFTTSSSCSFFIYFSFAFFDNYKLVLSSEEILRTSFSYFNPITRGTSTLSKMLEPYSRTTSSSHHLLAFFSLYYFHIAVFFTLAFTVSSKQTKNSYFSANQCHISLCCHLRISALSSEVDREQG